MMDEAMNFQSAAPKIPPRILCIGMPVRDLTFRIEELPERGFKVNASHFEEIAGGNGLNAAIGIVRLGGKKGSGQQEREQQQNAQQNGH